MTRSCPRSVEARGDTLVLPHNGHREDSRLKQAFARINAKQIYCKLVKESFIPATANACAVQRYIKHYGPKCTSPSICGIARQLRRMPLASCGR